METERTRQYQTSRFQTRKLSSLLSRCSLALILPWIIIVILTMIGISSEAETETLRNYVVCYLPFLLTLLFLLKDFSIVQPGQWPVKWSDPTVSQIISCFVFTTGLLYICSPARLFIAVSEIQLFITVPQLITVVSFTGFFSLSTLGTVLIAPVIEEYLYRRLIQDRLVFWGEGTAILITSLFFSLLHLSADRILDTFIAGIAFGYIHAKTGKMRWNILLHMTTNLVVVLLDCWYGLYLFICIAVLYVPVYLVRQKPWRNLNAGESGLSSGEKAKACFKSVPFWICLILYLAVIIWRS